jgi:flavin-dependent dehydrogenase
VPLWLVGRSGIDGVWGVLAISGVLLYVACRVQRATHMERFDALVVGGGPAGATSALLLAKAGWSVVVVERQIFPRRKVCGEYLSGTNWPLFRELNLDGQIDALAGPPVRRTAIWTGTASVQADLPCPDGHRWGCAVRREQLDSLLLDAAVRQGAVLRQPCRCVAIVRAGDELVCRVESDHGAKTSELTARVVIAAHGSWDIGLLPTQRQPAKPRGDDLLAFKAHFRETGLPDDLMPLLSFSGGYGGMVRCDGDGTTLSLCIRRDHLDRLGRGTSHDIGTSVLEYVADCCPMVGAVLGGARLDGKWLSVGPIQPGVRRCYADGVFVVGNAAAEAHPVIAEGISMAMQSAWLLAEHLISHRTNRCSAANCDRIGRVYSVAWRRNFFARLEASRAVAQWAMRPKVVAATWPMLYPSLITAAARLAGKSRPLYGPRTLRATTFS